MQILHTESSSGWGGQEIRILQEAIGLRERGHEIIFAVQTDSGLSKKAKQHGFCVYELSFKKPFFPFALILLMKLIKRHQIEIVNTHSSLDSWIGSLSAKLLGKKVIRTRHLSTPIRKGLNSRLLYNRLVDSIVTTSSCVIPIIAEQAKLPLDRICCIPTGVNPNMIQCNEQEAAFFRQQLQIKDEDILVGTVCVVRSWKGILDLLEAAKILKQKARNIKWVIVGGGYVKDYLPFLDKLDVKDVVTFAGHLESPYNAIAALDIFVLLSTANEGVSQASLQSSYLKKPLVTTTVGGLPEVCIHEKTGFTVPPFSPDKVAEAIFTLAKDAHLRKQFGESAKALVEEKFLFSHMLDKMEKVLQKVKR